LARAVVERLAADLWDRAERHPIVLAEAPATWLLGAVDADEVATEWVEALPDVSDDPHPIPGNAFV